MNRELWSLDAHDTAHLVAARTVSATEVLDAHLERIDRLNPVLNAIVARDDSAARQRASDIDSGLVTGTLAGAVMTTKINTDHIPFPTDNGIKALAAQQPVATHPCVTGLVDLGLVMAGRTNSPAYAMRFHTSNDLHGETLNPFDRELSCGGSSGGAGVAVATGMCHIAQGNDVGGSIRWPAMLNGIIGLRPTIGRMPTGGVNLAAPRGWSASNMATQGPLARTMRDVRTAYMAMASPNWDDPLWVPAPHVFPADRPRATVALVTHDDIGLHPTIRNAIVQTGKALASAGYEVVEDTPPMTETFFGLWHKLGAPELAHGLAPMLEAIDDPGLRTVVEDWLTILPPPTAETFMSGIADRDLVMRAWTKYFATHQIVVAPLMDTPRLERGQDASGPGSMETVTRAARWGFNLSATSMPALAFPTGVVDGVPVGVQLFARAFREDLLLAAGDALEAHFGRIEPVGCTWAA